MKINKKYLLGLVSGIVITCSASVIAASISASEIGFKSSHDGWNPKNVEEAVNYLYDNTIKVDLLWTNSNTTSSFSPDKLEIDLSEYDYIISSVYTTTTNDSLKIGLIELIDDKNCNTIGGSYARIICVSKNEVEFQTGQNVNVGWNNAFGIPYQIFGVKNLFLN